MIYCIGLKAFVYVKTKNKLNEKCELIQLAFTRLYYVYAVFDYSCLYWLSQLASSGSSPFRPSN